MISDNYLVYLGEQINKIINDIVNQPLSNNSDALETELVSRLKQVSETLDPIFKNPEPVDAMSLEGCKKIDRDYYNAKKSLAFLLNQEVLHSVAKLQLHCTPKEEVTTEQLRLFQILQTTYCYCEITLCQSRTFSDPLFTNFEKSLISECLNIFLISLQANDSFGSVAIHRYLLAFLLQTSEFFQLFPNVPSHWMSLEEKSTSLKDEKAWLSSSESKLFPLFGAIEMVSFAPTSHQYPDEFGIFYDCFHNIIKCANNSTQVRDWINRSGRLVKFIVKPFEDISVTMLIQAPKFEPALYKYHFPLLQMTDGTIISDIDINIKTLFQQIQDEETTGLNPSALFNVRLLERWLSKILKLMIDCRSKDIRNSIFKEIQHNILDLINAFFVREDITCSICYYTTYLLSEFVKVFSAECKMIQEELITPLMHEPSLVKMFLRCLNRDPNRDMIEDIQYWNKFTNNQVFVFKLLYQFFNFGLTGTLESLFCKEQSHSSRENSHFQLDSTKESRTLKAICYAITTSKGNSIETDQVAKQIVQNLISQNNKTGNNSNENSTESDHHFEFDPYRPLSYFLLATQACYFYSDPVTCLFSSGLLVLLAQLLDPQNLDGELPQNKHGITRNGLIDTSCIMNTIILENYKCIQLYRDIISEGGGSCKYIKPSASIQKKLFQSNDKLLEETKNWLMETFDSNEIINSSTMNQKIQLYETQVISLYCIEKVKSIRTSNPM